MNGLRIYIEPAPANKPSGRGVFYSRRENGPYYCWRFEEKLGRWNGLRITGDFDRSYLSVAWKVVPESLQAKLGEHYLE